MRTATVVLFYPDRQPEILHGANADEYITASTALINPVFPAGVPPHLWFKDGNKIGVRVSKSFELPTQSHSYVLHRPDLSHYIAVISITAATTFIFCLHFLSH